MDEKDFILQYRDLKITREALFCALQSSPQYHAFVYDNNGLKRVLYDADAGRENFAVSVGTVHLRQALTALQNNRISLQELLYWCDFIRFSNIFEITDEPSEQEAIVTVFDALQEWADAGKAIMQSEIAHLSAMLKQ